MDLRCPMYVVAVALGGVCPDAARCRKQCRFARSLLVQPSMAGMKVPPRVWRRSWVPGFWRAGSWVPGFVRRTYNRRK